MIIKKLFTNTNNAKGSAPAGRQVYQFRHLGMIIKSKQVVQVEPRTRTCEFDAGQASETRVSPVAPIAPVSPFWAILH
jgi:hypothetical protein